MKNCISLGAGIALTALATAMAIVPVHAQDRETAQPGDAAQGASLQTRRTEDGSIIVTARRFVPEGAITANKTNIPLIETPQSISVITRDQIDLLNFIDAQQAVRYTAGVFGENYGPDPRYDFVTVRGFTPKQYIDGLAVPATTTISATGVDLYAFQSLDILKGPSSTLYGSAPPGGILNEALRRPSDVSSGELLAKYGTHDYAQLAGTVTGAATPYLSLRMTGLFRDAQGEIEGQHTQRLLASPSATLKLGDNTKITALGYYQYDKVRGGAGGFLPAIGTLLPNPNGEIKRSTNLDSPYDLFERHQYAGGFDAEHRFSSDIVFHSNTKWSNYHESTPVGLYSGGGYVTVDAEDPADPANFRTLQQYNYAYDERVKSFATDNRIDATLMTGSIQHKLLLGVDYRNVRNVANYTFGFGDTLDAFDPVYSRAAAQYLDFGTRYNQQRLKQTGVYGQDQIAIGHLYLLASGRYDWINARSAMNVFAPVTSDPDFGDQKQHKFTYHLGANYVTDAGIAPYISYSTSFEPVLGTDIVTDRAFKPTSTKQWEGGVKMDARGLPKDVKLFATAALFDIKQKNFVTAQNGQTNVVGSTQGGLVEVWGGEVELVARIHEQLSINASYSYNHSEVKSSPNAAGDIGFPLPTTPKHKLSLFTDYTFQQGMLAGFGLGGGVRYNSKSAGGLPSTTYPQLVAGQPIFTGQATLFDAILHYDLPHWRIAVNGSNILDKKYVARCSGTYGCVYGAGRQVIGTVTYKF